MIQDEQLLNIIIQQSRHLVILLETLAQYQQQVSATCPHPEEKVVTLGTMGHTTTLCTMCQHEINPEKEAAS